MARLNAQSTRQIEGLLAEVNAAERAVLVGSLGKARAISDGRGKPAVRIVRLTAVQDVALAILQEYFEAVQVVQRDKPGDLRKLMMEPASGMWVAYLDDDCGVDWCCAGCARSRMPANASGCT